jgi:hypothetical protein
MQNVENFKHLTIKEMGTKQQIAMESHFHGGKENQKKKKTWRRLRWPTRKLRLRFPTS